MRQFEEIKADVLSHGDLIQGDVSLGMPPTAASVLAGMIAETFSRDYPEVQLHLVSGFSNFVLEWLIRGEIDVAVLYDTNLPKGLRTKPLMQENLMFVAPPNAGLSLGKPISFEKATENQLILPSPQHSLRILIEEIANQKNLELSVVIAADGLAMLKDMVNRRLGCTFLPGSVIRRELADGRLSAAPVINPKISHDLVLALPTDRPISNTVNKFTEILHQLITQTVSSDDWTEKT